QSGAAGLPRHGAAQRREGSEVERQELKSPAPGARGSRLKTISQGEKRPVFGNTCIPADFQEKFLPPLPQFIGGSPYSIASSRCGEDRQSLPSASPSPAGHHDGKSNQRVGASSQDRTMPDDLGKRGPARRACVAARACSASWGALARCLATTSI